MYKEITRTDQRSAQPGARGWGKPPEPRRRVWVVLMEGFELLDVAGPIQVLDSAREHGAPYEIQLVGMDPSVTSAQGIVVQCQPGLPEVAADDHVVVPGADAGRRELINPSLLDWLRSSAAAGAQVSSICAGRNRLERVVVAPPRSLH